MSSTTTPNMSLIVPTVGQEPGPNYANDVNADLSILDGHNHTPGSGVLITPAALNINTNLSFQGNAITNLSALTLLAQTTAPTTAQSLYVKNGTENVPLPDLWYFDGTNNVQLTSGGNVNATIASIPGESYGAGTFTWRQGTGSTTPANFDIGSITIRPTVASTTYGITLSTPSGIASAFSLILPALPSQQNLLTLDSSGNLVASWNVDNTTLQVSSNLIGVKAGGIGTTQLANASVTPLKKSALGQVISTDFGAFTTTSTTYVTTPLTLSITTTGTRPVRFEVVSDGSNDPLLGDCSISGSLTGTAPSSVTQVNALFKVVNTATGFQCASYAVTIGNYSPAFSQGYYNATPATIISGIDTSMISSGNTTQTYQVYMLVSNTNFTGRIQGCQLLAYEL